jgi:RNA polymerase sigma factor (sigma-70 family)
MTTTTLPSISTSDAELVAASRNGNREAFGQIVRKYQSMISGLIYAACGDLHRSEDIAQETFISAWKSLSGLRDAAKLPGWLCQIARHRIADHFRESSTQKVQLQEQLAETIPAEVPDQAMSAEEGEMLWRTLARIPQPYRETMVLYYRQGQSTADVAAAMETTDAGVRQRLARGRQMLRDEMAAMVERNLAKSAPGPEFSLAVMAALPLAAAQTATITGATAKGSAAAKGGMLFFLLNWLAPILGVLSMGLITFHSIRRTSSGRAKKYIVGYWVAFWSFIIAWILLCNELVYIGHRFNWEYPTYIWVFAAAGCFYGMGLFGLMAWGAPYAARDRQVNHKGEYLRTFWLRLIFVAPLIYSGVAWLVSLSLRAHDRTSAEIIAGTALLGSAVCAWRASNEALAKNPLKMAFESWLLMDAIVVISLDLRLHSWSAVVDHLGIVEATRQIPLWSINVFGAALFLWTSMLMLRQSRAKAI